MNSLIAKFLSLFLVFLFLSSFFALFAAVRPVKIESSWTPDQFGFEYENVTLTTEDGINLDGWFVPNENSDKVVILMHGYPADKGDILPLTLFLAEDYNLLFFDFRGLGKSEGKISYLGAKELYDLKSAIKFLDERGFKRIGLWGFSFGGAVALMGNGLSQVTAVISDSAFAELFLMAPELFRLPLLDKPLGFLTLFWGRLIFGINALEVSPVKAVKDSQKPIFVIHSKEDEVIPFGHALMLKEVLRCNTEAKFWFTEGHHGLLGEDYQSQTESFFEKNL